MDFDATGHLSVTVLKERGVPRDADFYLCGPSAFLQDLTSGLAAWGVTRERVHTEMFGPTPSSTPGLVGTAPSLPPHLPAGSPGTGPLVSFARSGLVGSTGTLRTRACSNLPRCALFRSDGRAGRESVIAAKAG